MDRAEHIRALQAEYAQLQAQDRREAEARLREVLARDPEIGVLRTRGAAIALEAMREMMRQTDLEKRRQAAEKMRRDGLENNRQLRLRLTALGLPEDYLEEKHRCEKCRDTGYTDDIPARFCECFQKALRLRMFEDGTMAGLDRQNFAHFSDELVRKCNPPQEAQNLLFAKTICQQFAQEYPRVERPNLLLYGPGGVGKTFLLNCVFARLLERGFSGVRITAYRMHETMRLKHIGAQEEAQGFEELIQTPILVIDDLGTEPMLRNITVEYLFTLLNERCAAGRATLIATNLSPAELKERYGERVASRLLDRSRCVTVRMAGADLRQGKLRNGGEEA